MQIGNILREARIKTKLSVKQISDILISKGYKASEKTVYSWESGNSRPDIEILMTLCDIYGIKDILKTFGYNGYKEDGSIQLNMKEIEHIDKYRSLDSYGQETISYILDRETERVASLRKQEAHISELEKSALSGDTQSPRTRIINYYYRLASAGTGQILFDMPPTKRIEIPDIPEYRKADYAICVNGNSMEPTYYDGDTLLVEMTDHIDVGEIGIFSVDNECYVKEHGNTKLISLNPSSDNIPLNETAHCMGRVIGKL